MHKFLLGCGAAVASIAVAALAVVEGGLFDVAASSPHSPLVAWATHATMIHSVRLRSRGEQLPAPSTDAVNLGFREYEKDCVTCHGGPGIARAPWVDGMTPTPPYLLDASRLWSAPELFWIVKNGVKMTGMPAWGATKSDREIRDLVAFLEALPALSAEDYRKMRAENDGQSVADDTTRRKCGHESVASPTPRRAGCRSSISPESARSVFRPAAVPRPAADASATTPARPKNSTAI